MTLNEHHLTGNLREVAGEVDHQTHGDDVTDVGQICGEIKTLAISLERVR